MHEVPDRVSRVDDSFWVSGVGVGRSVWRDTTVPAGHGDQAGSRFTTGDVVWGMNERILRACWFIWLSFKGQSVGVALFCA